MKTYSDRSRRDLQEYGSPFFIQLYFIWKIDYLIFDCYNCNQDKKLKLCITAITTAIKSSILAAVN